MLDSKKMFIVFVLLFISNNSFSHEDGAKFSGAIIDPLRVHHAHIEDEQRVNFSVIDGLAGETMYRHSLELALKWSDDFRWGSEILIPYTNEGSNGSGVGDIQAQLIKYAFVNEPEIIMTGMFSVSLPTGDKSKGLGGENTGIEVALFVDKAYKNWYWGLNLELGTVISGEDETEFELATALSYSFIKGTTNMAPPKPHQKFVPSLSLELISENIIGGAEKGTGVLMIVPGIHLWHTKSDWSVRFGVEVPVSSDKENDRVYLLQIGTHQNWGTIVN